jgi:hypothetical protein
MGKGNQKLLPIKPKKDQARAHAHINAKALADFFANNGLRNVTVAGAVVTVPLHGRSIRMLVMRA